MHSSVLVFVDEGITSLEQIMRCYDETTEESDLLKFEQHIAKKDINKEYKKALKPSKWRDNLNGWKEAKQLSPKTFFEGSEGYVSDENGNLGYRRNPNGKYDWYECGGRWAHTLIDKKEGKCSRVRLKNIDLEAMKNDVIEYYGNLYDKQKNNRNEFIIHPTNIVDQLTKEEYIEKNNKGLRTFFLNLVDEEQWIELDGLSDEEANDTIFAFINSHHPNTMVYVVDIHY